MYALYLCARFAVKPANTLLTHFSCKSDKKHAVSRVQLKAIRHSGPRNRARKYYSLGSDLGINLSPARRPPLGVDDAGVSGFIDPCKTRMVTLEVRLVSPADS